MSACVPSDRLKQTLTVHVPGATGALLDLEIYNVMDEFFRRTNAWQWSEDINMEVGVQEYPLAVPAGAAVVRALSVAHNGVPMAPFGSSSGGGKVSTSSSVALPAEMTFPDGDTSYAPIRTSSGVPPVGSFTYAVYRPKSISIGVLPDDTTIQQPLSVVVALSLGKGCLECDCGDWDVPEWMWESYFNVWNDGVMGRLYGMVAKPWSNQTLAVYHHKRFRNQMGYHKQEAARGFAYAVPAWRFPGTWSRR